MKKILLTAALGIILCVGLLNAKEIFGYLDETGDADHFTLSASKDTVWVTFTVPEDAEFAVVVLGSAGANLGYFELNEDEGYDIKLTGGGKFTLVIICRSGDGKWTAAW
jgi:hypothetical protein